MKNKKPKVEKHLCVFDNRSEYYPEDGRAELFQEGIISQDAKKRIKDIRDSFESGFLDSLISNLQEGKASVDVGNVSITASSSVKVACSP